MLLFASYHYNERTRVTYWWRKTPDKSFLSTSVFTVVQSDIKTTEILQFDMGIMFVQCDKQQSQKTIKNRTVWARLKRIEDLHAFLWTATVFDSDPGTVLSLSGRGWTTCLNHCLSFQDTDSSAIGPVFWVIALTECGRSDFSVPRQGFEDLNWPFGQFSAIGPAFCVLWWLYEGPGCVETKTFRTRLWTLSWLHIRAKV